jgi:hypothetical protein
MWTRSKTQNNAQRSQFTKIPEQFIHAQPKFHWQIQVDSGELNYHVSRDNLDTKKKCKESGITVWIDVRIAHAYGFLSQNSVLCVGTTRISSLVRGIGHEKPSH